MLYQRPTAPKKKKAKRRIKDEEYRQINCRVKLDLYEQFTAAAQKEGISNSELIRQLFVVYLNQAAKEE